MHLAPTLIARALACLVVCTLVFTAQPVKAGIGPFIVAQDFPVASTGIVALADLAVDAAGNNYISGVLGSYSFPGVNTVAVTNGGFGYKFVAKFAPFARSPTFTAVVGAAGKVVNGSLQPGGRHGVSGMALDASGNTFVAAYDVQLDYISSGGQYRTDTGPKYIYKVSSGGQVTRHSIALDPAIQRVVAIAVDAAGAIYLTGSAGAGMATTVGAPYATAAVATNCIAPFAQKLAPSGQTVVYSTYLGFSGASGQLCGGTANVHFVDPTGFAIAIDPGGNAFITGQSEPGALATPGALDLGDKTPAYFYPLDSFHPTASHAFVTKLNANGGIVYSARLGGSLRDRGTSIVIDSTGAAIVAGKTSSQDFPLAFSVFSYPTVYLDCVLFTPEVGFLSKLSADGSQLLFSTYLPLDGGQLDDCQARFDGTLNYEPARVALDASGDILVAGYTLAKNRDLPSTAGAIIPAPASTDDAVGEQLLQVFSSDGRTLLYSSPLGGSGVQGLGIDTKQTITIADGYRLLRLVPGSLPVEIAATPNPACVGQSVAVTVTVAAAPDSGSVDFSVDGALVGSAAVAAGIATKVLTLPVGVRALRASYHGTGPFDGQGSIDYYLPVNQAGACM